MVNVHIVNRRWGTNKLIESCHFGTNLCGGVLTDLKIRGGDRENVQKPCPSLYLTQHPIRAGAIGH